MSLIINNSEFLLKGLGYTILLSIVCIIFSLFIGIVIGTLRTLNNSIVILVSKTYIDLFRGLPILITLFLVFFIIPMTGINFSNFASAAIALSLWASANIAESVRGAIQSIPKAQTEASYSLGLTHVQTMIYVIIPQATKRVLPSIIGLLTNLVQATSLTILIGNIEFLKSAQIIIERIEIMEGKQIAFTIYSLVLLGYFIICYPLSLLSKRLERNLNT
ncbi:amino acid ABC transporter permease [Sporosarcina sp. FSL W7-1349]|uniref:amino acid ABC transporter permease n=1 Tax=Sporosarcina sp. FSL W7-1349 TaxID=2921561 RepID=UPI0030F94909